MITITNYKDKLSVILLKTEKIKSCLTNSVLGKMDFSQCSSELISLRNQIEMIDIEGKNQLLEVGTHAILKSCLKSLAKCQKLLLNQFVSHSNPTDFYQKISEVWTKMTKEKCSSQEFGIRFFIHHRTDPLLLQSLHEYLNPHSDMALFVKKHIHHKVFADDFKKLIHFDLDLDFEFRSFLYNFLKSSLKELNLSKDEEVRNFILQNLNHPLVAEATNRAIVFFLKSPAIPDFLIEEYNLKKISRTQWDDIVRDLTKDTEMLACASKTTPYEYSTDLFYSILTISDREEPNPELLKNFELAYEALEFAIRKVRYSSNYFNREDTHFNEKHFDYTQLKNIQTLLKNHRDSSERKARKKSELNPLFQNYFFLNATIDKLNESERITNCGGLAASALMYVSHFTRAVLGHLEDHAFIIIGYGTNAVICDPWARKIYPVKFIEKFLKDYAYVNALGYPALKSFDIKNFKLVDETIISPADFELNTQNKYPRLGLILDAFIYSEDFAEKQRLAEDLLDEANKTYRQDPDDLIKKLISQVNYFLFSKPKTPKKYVYNL